MKSSFVSTIRLPHRAVDVSYSIEIRQEKIRGVAYLLATKNTKGDCVNTQSPKSLYLQGG